MTRSSPNTPPTPSHDQAKAPREPRAPGGAEVAGHPDEVHPHDLGLAHDLAQLSRRRLLGLFGGAGLLALAGCADDAEPVESSTSASASVPSRDGQVIPQETAGPFPGDGSNGPNVLDDSGIVRSDLTRSLPPAEGVAQGVALVIELRLMDASGGTGAPLTGRAVYLWHCSREGDYSMYSEAARGETFLRGVQASDADGMVRFTTIFPGCYAGRWPHAHFEIYESVEAATSGGRKVRTTQLALPEDVCHAVYATEGYEASLGNLARLSLDTDSVFSDGYSLQLARVTGSMADGLTASLNVPL